MNLLMAVLLLIFYAKRRVVALPGNLSGVLYTKIIFGGHLFSEDDHSHWAPPYWNIMKETFSLGRTEV